MQEPLQKSYFLLIEIHVQEKELAEFVSFWHEKYSITKKKMQMLYYNILI